MFVINIYNKSSVVTNDEVKIMISGCELLIPILCEKWSILLPSIQFIEGNPLNSSRNDILFVMLDNSDQVGALGYHTEENNRVNNSHPDIIIFTSSFVTTELLLYIFITNIFLILITIHSLIKFLNILSIFVC